MGVQVHKGLQCLLGHTIFVARNMVKLEMGLRVNGLASEIMVPGFIQASFCKIQGLFKDF